MRKVKLVLEHLKVDSFVTAAADGRGTVLGHQSDTILTHPDSPLCGPTAGTCDEFCAAQDGIIR